MFGTIYSLVAVIVTFISIFVLSANVDRKLTITYHFWELMWLTLAVVGMGALWPFSFLALLVAGILFCLMKLFSFATTLFHRK